MAVEVGFLNGLANDWEFQKIFKKIIQIFKNVMNERRKHMLIL